MYRPLADELRPQTLDEVFGQEHILGRGGLLRRVIDSGTVPNMIFYGPSGCGKTTVANIIAQKAGRTLHKINATTAGIADIKAIIDDLDTMMAPDGVLIYLDEIQYFNKKQQQSLLQYLENGKITMIASTTENPYFYVYNAVLSRCTVFEFKELAGKDVLKAVARAFDAASSRKNVTLSCEPGVMEYIADACGGDVRKAINAVELLTDAGRITDGVLSVPLSDAQLVTQKSAMRYDRAGDSHYDIISALQKSIRGSDPDAGLHYLARLVEAGDLPIICRRLLVTAAEDIGLAYPQAIPIVKACVDSALQLGLPEAALPLADAVVLLATAPKSNSAYVGLHRAMEDVQSGKSGEIPRQLQNKHADTTGITTGQGYLYPHDYPDHYVAQQYLPDALRTAVYYEYGPNKNEQAAKKYWDAIKKKGD